MDPVIQAAAYRVGFPSLLGSAIARQESNYGQSSPNMFQITSSTAADPGYGVAPISAQDVNDPYKAALFSMELMKAKAQAQGLDVNDPNNWAKVAQLHNGGGDPNYVQHVLGPLGMTGGSSGAAGGVSAPPNVGFGQPVQSQQLPAMPDSFGAQTQPNTPAPTVNTAGHTGDPLIAFGTALMGGQGWHDGIAKAGAAYADAQAQQQQNNRLDASLQNEADNRDADAPLRAAQVASQRAAAWKALNPVITPEDALDANLKLGDQAITQRGQDIQLQDAMMRNSYMAKLTAGQPQQFVLPGDDGSPKAIIEAQHSKTGAMTYTNTNTGQTGGSLADVGADGAVPAAVYNPEAQRNFALDKMGTKDVSTILQQGMTADNNNQTISNELAALGKPGALAGPGFAARVGRLIDSTAGTSIFGNLGDEQSAAMLAGQGNGQAIRNAIQGAGRLTNMDTALLGKNTPNLATDPDAAKAVLGVLQRVNSRQSQIASGWNSMDPALQRSIIRTPNGVQDWEYKTNQRLLSQDTTQQPGAGSTPPQGGSTPPAAPQPGAGALPPLSSY